jgi:hypothetical protein
MLTAKDSGGGTYKPAPPGTFLARCYRLIDLGTQRVEFSGEVKLQMKLQLGWELHGEDDAGNPLIDDETMPLTIGKRFTNSLHKKASLRRDLEAWRGRAFSDEELRGFDLRNLLDKWALITVIHSERDGKTFANVASITAVPGAMRKSLPKGIHDLEAFDITAPDMKLFEAFHQKLRETIEAATEWADRGKSQKHPGAVEDLPADAMEIEEEIPF